MSRKWLRRILRLFAVMALGAGIAWPCANALFRHGFDAEVESLRASGLRVDLSAFNLPPVPDRQNAAVVLREGVAWRKECGLDLEAASMDWEMADEAVRDRVAAGESSDEDQIRERDEAWSKLQKVVADLHPWYVRIERAVAMRECDFGIDYSKLLDRGSESAETTINVVQSLEWRVRVRVREDGSVPASIRDCETLLRWAPHIGSQFTEYSFYKTLHAEAGELVRLVSAQPGFVAGFARSRLDSLLAAAEDDDARLRSVVDFGLAVHIATLRLWTTWDGARQLLELRARSAALSEIESDPTAMDRFMDPRADSGALVRVALRRPWILRDATRSLATWKEAAVILFRDDLGTRPDLLSLVAQYRDTHAPEVSEYSTAAVLDSIRLRLRAHLRVTRIGLAALEHRDRHGAWPKSAADLAPLFPEGVPKDPFTRQPFALATDGATLTIECGVDDRDRVSWTIK